MDETRGGGEMSEANAPETPTAASTKADPKPPELSDEERANRRQILEALILGSNEAVSARKLGAIVPDGSAGLIRQLVEELNAEYAEQCRAFEICAVAGGFEVRTRAAFAEYLRKLQEERPLRLSRAALETLAIVSYRQPLTRGEIEQIRGVDAGPVLRTMIERKLVRITGHRDTPGNPMLYATTKRFLEVFGLNSLADLPSLRDLKELAAEEQQELDLETNALEDAMVGSDAVLAEGGETAESGDLQSEDAVDETENAGGQEGVEGTEAATPEPAQVEFSEPPAVDLP